MHRFTLGVEEEFQIVDPSTWELRSHVSELLASSGAVLGDRMKRELHQSIVEVGTRICANAAELRDEIFRTREALVAAAGRAGARRCRRRHVHQADHRCAIRHAP
jgi:carboxylate-amine ligase